MAEVGSAFVSLVPSARGFGAKMQSEVGGEVDGAGKKVGSRFGTAFKAGALAVVAGAGVLAKFLGDSLGEAREAQKVGALTTATIKATGGAAGVTAKQVGDLAGALSTKTGIDDEVIQSGQNMLLTFKNIRNEAGAGNDIFNQSTAALIDMASAMGTEPKQAAIQLGKALNDPIKGVTALTRVGVQFTDQQRAQIKAMVESGNTMGAQKVILKELNSQFGGAAEAQATASDKARVAMGNLQEQIGTALIPVVDRMANLFTNTVVPAISSFVAGMQTGTGLGGQFAATARSIGSGLMAIGKFAIENRTALLVLAGAYAAVRVAMLAATAASQVSLLWLKLHTVGTIQHTVVSKAAAAVAKAWAAVQWVLNAALAANPIGIVVVALAAFVAAIVLAWKNSETFRKIVTTAWNAVKSTAVAVFNAVKAVIVGAWNAIKAATSATWNAIKAVISAQVNAVRAVVTAGFNALRGVVTAAFNAIKSAITAAWSAIRGVVTTGVNTVKSVVTSGFNALKGVVTSAWNAIKTAVQGGIDGAVNLAKSLPGRIVSALGSLGSLLFSKGAELIQGLINGIMSKIGAVGDAIGNVAGKIKGFLPGSPVKEGPLRSWNNGGAGKRLVEMLASGIDSGGPLVTHASNRLASRIAAPTMAAAGVSAADVAPSGESLGAKLDRVATILERMPKSYQLGQRQGAS